jgi:ribosomal protein L37AE/L43A
MRGCAKCEKRSAFIRLDYAPPIWVCAECATEIVNAPHNIERMERDEAEEELRDLKRSGGKPQ